MFPSLVYRIESQQGVGPYQSVFTLDRYTRPLDDPEVVSKEEWQLFRDAYDIAQGATAPEEAFGDAWKILSDLVETDGWLFGASSVRQLLSYFQMDPLWYMIQYTDMHLSIYSSKNYHKGTDQVIFRKRESDLLCQIPLRHTALARLAQAFIKTRKEQL